MSKWQPIETAPKDGTPVLLYGPYRWIAYDNRLEMENARVLVGEFERGKWWSVSDNPYNDTIYPLFWMPLPASP